MRDIDRIEPFLIEVGNIWKEYFPDWRFGQLISNLCRFYTDPFYLEDDRFIEVLEQFAKEMTCKIEE